MKRNSFFKKPSAPRTVQCDCGSVAKSHTRKNYSFGRKSTCTKTTDYVCSKCGKRQ